MLCSTSLGYIIHIHVYIFIYITHFINIPTHYNGESANKYFVCSFYICFYSIKTSGNVHVLVVQPAYTVNDHRRDSLPWVKDRVYEYHNGSLLGIVVHICQCHVIKIIAKMHCLRVNEEVHGCN